LVVGQKAIGPREAAIHLLAVGPDVVKAQEASLDKIDGPKDLSRYQHMLALG
jgi:hypothetical protein